ncbi:hypothetical protein [Mammaliicoccus sciuri]|uniref:hypothetical protein n=1 Tax=Mammaliicoccus sciuri TaxID=1296 RepID=UPI002DB6CF2E|nr:hypothetical protein [Mammaliicoccus sciuri]MEB8265363.1 hypothetical protein [Mammaliicoccus sciuri]
MKSLVKIIQVVLVIALVITIVTLMTLISKQGTKNEVLKKELGNIEKVQSKSNYEPINQDGVKSYEKKTKKKLDSFLKNEYKDDTAEDEGSAYSAMRALFGVVGHHIILNENSTNKDYLDYYAPFEYKIDNFSARNNGSDVEVMFNVKTTYDGEPINENNTLMKLTFNSQDELVGGSLYGE